MRCLCFSCSISPSCNKPFYYNGWTKSYLFLNLPLQVHVVFTSSFNAKANSNSKNEVMPTDIQLKSKLSPAAEAASDRWGRISSAGGSRWVASRVAHIPSFAALKPVMERVRSNSKTTRFGTKFIGSLSTLDSNLNASYNKKLLGIGAKASFIGGSGQSVGSGLAVYSIYHRQESQICPTLTGIRGIGGSDSMS